MSFTIYVSLLKYYKQTCFLKASEIRAVKVFRYEGALCFASFHYFLTSLVRKTGLVPVHPLYLPTPFPAANEGPAYCKANEPLGSEHIPLLASADVGGRDFLDVDAVFSHYCTDRKNGSIPTQEKENDDGDRWRMGCDSNRSSKDSNGLINVQCIVLDCSGWSYIDDTSTTNLFEVRTAKTNNLVWVLTS